MKKFAVGANDLVASIPQFWALNVLSQLDAFTFMPSIVLRDYENELANYGDTVNCRRPNRMTAGRKSPSSLVVDQDVSFTAVPVKLDMQVINSFVLGDRDMTLSADKLTQTFGSRATQALAELIDRSIFGQVYQFIDRTAGRLGGLTGSTAQSYLVSVRQQMNNLNIPAADRMLVLTNSAEAAMLNSELFVSAEKVGDSGTALREGSLGRKFGLNTVASSLAFDILDIGDTIAAKTVATTARPASSTVITLNNANSLVVGMWVNIGGVPYQITAISGADITIHRGLVYPAAIGDSVKVGNTLLVNNAGGYSAGYNEAIAFDNAGFVPQVGQMLCFGTVRYAVIAVVGSTVLLDRSLEAAIADNQQGFLGLPGSYNLAFNKEAISLVNRPLIAVMDGAGAKSAVVVDKDLAIRAVIGYERKQQQHTVGLDLLMGVKTLNTEMGVVLLG